MALVLLVPIVVPMAIARIRNHMSFETRKLLHMLSLPFALALLWHVDQRDGFLPQVS